MAQCLKILSTPFLTETGKTVQANQSGLAQKEMRTARDDNINPNDS